MKTIRLLFSIIILHFSFYISSSAQQIDESAYFKKKPGLINYPEYEPQIHKEIDTLYYPYYNDVQMLRITHRYAWFDHPTFVKTDIYEYIQQVPVYLFRNKEGKILKRLNTLGREISAVNLHHADDPHQDQWSHVRLKRNAYVGDPKNRGLWGIYPMYVKSDDAKILVGAFDSLGNTFIEPIYESIEYVDSIFIVQKDGKFGLLDFNKKIILDFKYDEITYKHYYQKFIFTTRDGKSGIYFINGKNFVPEEYQSIKESDYLRPCFEMQKNGKYFFAEPKSKRMIPLSFTTYNVRWLKNQYLQFDKEWILMDSTGNILCKSKNEVYEMVNQNRFLTNRWNNGYFRQIVDANGNAVKEKEYYYLNKLNENVLMGWTNPEIIDHSGYKKPTKAVLLDTDGNQICDEEFDSFEKIDDYYLKAFKNGKMYFINERGKVIIDEKIDGGGKLFEHVYLYAKDGKSYLFDPQNPNNKSEAYDQISYKSEGVLGVKKGEKYGFLDSNRTQLTEFIYDQIQGFHFGVAQVKIGENWFLIDKLGNILSDDYKMTQDVGGGFTLIKKKDKFGVINNKGKVIVEPEFDKCVTISKKKDDVYGFLLRKDNKDGMIGVNGEIIHPFEFETLYDINGNNSTYEFMREGYYAGGWKHNRTTREFYHFNYDSTKTKVEIKANPNMGFEIYGNVNKKGVRNWEKKMVIPQKYEQIEEMKFNTFKVYQKERGCGLLDTNGKVIIPIGYVYLRDHYDDFITVGRNYQTDWGLYKYDGTMIADTLYGGFDRMHFGMIPYYASFNHRIENKQWVHDEKKVGLMDSTGKIIIEANYDSYQIPDQFKDEFLFINPHETILVNSKGELLERNGTTAPSKVIPKVENKGFFKKIFKGKRAKFK